MLAKNGAPEMIKMGNGNAGKSAPRCYWTHALNSHAWANGQAFSKSLAKRRRRISHAKVRSTTHHWRRILNPLALQRQQGRAAVVAPIALSDPTQSAPHPCPSASPRRGLPIRCCSSNGPIITAEQPAISQLWQELDMLRLEVAQGRAIFAQTAAISAKCSDDGHLIRPLPTLPRAALDPF